MNEEPDDPISALHPEFCRLLRTRPDIAAAFDIVLREIASTAYEEGRARGICLALDGRVSQEELKQARMLFAQQEMERACIGAPASRSAQ